MPPPFHPDPLDVIYEDDETDEGAVSLDGGGTSLHAHPDHEHATEAHGDAEANVLAKFASGNVLLHEDVVALAQEVARADAEMARWRSRCRRTEDERDALRRELDRCKAELERCYAILAHHPRPQSTVLYSSTTAEGGSLLPEQVPSVYRPKSPPAEHPRIPSPGLQTLPPDATRQRSLAPPAVAMSLTRQTTPPGVGVPTHRGRLPPPRTTPSLVSHGSDSELTQESSRWDQESSLADVALPRRLPAPKELEYTQRTNNLLPRRVGDLQIDSVKGQLEWENLQLLLQQHDANNLLSPIVYSTAAHDEWNYVDILGRNESDDPARRLSFSSPAYHTPGHSSAYPQPNSHGQGQQTRHETAGVGRRDATTLPPVQSQDVRHIRTHAQLRAPLTQSLTKEERGQSAQHHRLSSVEGFGSGLSSASSSSTSSTGSHAPRTPPPDAATLAPPGSAAPFILSPTSAAFSPKGVLGLNSSTQALAPQKQQQQHLPGAPFQQQPQHVPVVDPEFGPVIVHGPLPPRHHHQGPQASNHYPPMPPRRKRDTVSVPPRYLAGGGGGGGGGGSGGSGGAGGAAVVQAAPSPFGGKGLASGVAVGAVTAADNNSDDGWVWGGRR